MAPAAKVLLHLFERQAPIHLFPCQRSSSLKGHLLTGCVDQISSRLQTELATGHERNKCVQLFSFGSDHKTHLFWTCMLLFVNSSPVTNWLCTASDRINLCLPKAHLYQTINVSCQWKGDCSDYMFFIHLTDYMFFIHLTLWSSFFF